MRRASAAHNPGVSLFPFLAVLICTMGVMMLLLVIINRPGAAAIDDSEPPPGAVFEEGGKGSAATIAKANGDGGAASAASAELQSAREMIEWRISQLQMSRDKTVGDLRDERLRLATVEDGMRKLRDQWELVKKAAGDIVQADNAKDHDKQSVAAFVDRLKSDLTATHERVGKAIDEARSQPPAYAIVPYDGPSGTRRQPIYIECRDDAVVLQPEGIKLNEHDFDGPKGPGNPLASTIRAARDYLAGGTAPTPGREPYPLLIVRSDGIVAFYMARSAMSSWASDFGYELIEADRKLVFQRPDPRLAEVEKAALADARSRYAWFATTRTGQEEQAPRERPVYRVAGTGGIKREGEASLADADGGSTGSGTGSSGFGAPGNRFGAPGTGGGFGGTGTGTGTGTGSGGGYGTPGTGSGGGNGTGTGGTGIAMAGGPGGGPAYAPGDNYIGLSGGAPGSSGYVPGGSGDGTGSSGYGTGGNGGVSGGPGNGSGIGTGNGNGSGVGSGNGLSGGPSFTPGNGYVGLPGSGGSGGSGYGTGGGSGSPNGVPGGGQGSGPGGIAGRPIGYGTGNASSGIGGLGGGTGSGTGFGTGAGTGTSGGSNIGYTGVPGSGNVNGGSGSPGVPGGGIGTMGYGSGVATNGMPGGAAVPGGNSTTGYNPGGTQNTSYNAVPGSTGANSPSSFSGNSGVSGGNMSAGQSSSTGAAGAMAGDANSTPPPGTVTSNVTVGQPGGSGGSSGSPGGDDAASGGASLMMNNSPPPRQHLTSDIYNTNATPYPLQSAPTGPRPGEYVPSPEPVTYSDKPKPLDDNAARSHDSLAEKRGHNWSLPSTSKLATPVSRTIHIVCRGDCLILKPDFGNPNSKVIAFGPRTADSVDKLVAAVWDYTKGWGIAGRQMYWKPRLELELGQSGEGRYSELQALLSDSGLEVARKQTIPSVTQLR